MKDRHETLIRQKYYRKIRFLTHKKAKKLNDTLHKATHNISDIVALAKSRHFDFEFTFDEEDLP